MYIYIYTYVCIHIKLYVHDMLTSPPGGALRSGDRHGPRRPRGRVRTRRPRGRVRTRALQGAGGDGGDL